MFDFELMQMADSGLPTGGFAFSQGLESATVLGLVGSENLLAYLDGVIEQWGSFDLPFLRDFFEKIPETQDLYDASLLNQGTYRASLAQGRALCRLWEQRPPEVPHYLMVLAEGLVKLNWSKEKVQKLFLFTSLRDQCSAAVRLGLCGPLAAYGLQRDLFPSLDKVYRESQGKRSQDASRASPILDIAQAVHPRLYSKLFQN